MPGLPSREDKPALQNIVIVGASYAGAHAAELLARSLPPTHRLVLVERRTHFAHVYIWPRFVSYDSGHAPKSFVPFENFLTHSQRLDETCPTAEDKEKVAFADSVIVHAHATKITDTHVLLDHDMCAVPSITEDCLEVSGGATLVPSDADCRVKGKQCCQGSACIQQEERCRGRAIPYAYLVYALGARLPRPLFSEARTKADGVNFLQQRHKAIRQAKRILICGGGALGIQLATDIADSFPPSEKSVTLVHSRTRLLPLFDISIHETAVRRMKDLGIELILGERLTYPGSDDDAGEMVLQTSSGRELISDLRIWATGQLPNSGLMRQFAPATVDEQGFIKTRRSLQLENTARPHVFAIGDCIDGFGAIKAGHVGWNQAGIAAHNITEMIVAEKENRTPILKEYYATPPMIHLTLGLREGISQILSGTELKVTTQSDMPPETSWRYIWACMGADPSDPSV